jgi:hypothetical protein
MARFSLYLPSYVFLWTVLLLLIQHQFQSCSAQPLYISQICPTNRHELLSLAPAFEAEEDDAVYQIYQGDDEDDVESGDVLLFRECTCPRPTGFQTPLVCPIDSRFCAVPTDLSQPVMCYAEDASVMVVRNVSLQSVSQSVSQ